MLHRTNMSYTQRVVLAGGRQKNISSIATEAGKCYRKESHHPSDFLHQTSIVSHKTKVGL